LTHPYSQYEGTDLWRTLEQALTELQANRDLAITTAPEYVVGSLCQALSSKSDVSPDGLSLEARRLTRRLATKVVHRAWRHRANELGLQFTDGTQFFVARLANGLDFSIVDGPPPPRRSKAGSRATPAKGSLTRKTSPRRPK
jgi:hypothetical protein